MANIDLTIRAEGDDFDAASIKTPFSDLSTGVNDLELEAIERHALHGDKHLTTLIPTSVFNSGMSNSGEHTAGAYNTDFGAGPLPGAYQTFGAQASIGGYGAGAPYGRPVAPDVGWRIVNGDTGGPAEVTLNAATTLANADVTHVMLHGSVSVYDWLNSTSAATYPSTDCILVALGFEDNGGTRYIFQRSIRWYSLRSLMYGSAETTTLVDQTLLDTPYSGATPVVGRQVAAFFFAICSEQRDSINQNQRPHIDEYHFSALPLRAGSL